MRARTRSRGGARAGRWGGEAGRSESRANETTRIWCTQRCEGAGWPADRAQHALAGRAWTDARGWPACLPIVSLSASPSPTGPKRASHSHAHARARDALGSVHVGREGYEREVERVEQQPQRQAEQVRAQRRGACRESREEQRREHACASEQRRQEGELLLWRAREREMRTSGARLASWTRPARAVCSLPVFAARPSAATPVTPPTVGHMRDVTAVTSLLQRQRAREATGAWRVHRLRAHTRECAHVRVQRRRARTFGIPYSVSLSEVAASAAALPTLAVRRMRANSRTGGSFEHSHASLRSQGVCACVGKKGG